MGFLVSFNGQFQKINANDFVSSNKLEQTRKSSKVNLIEDNQDKPKKENAQNLSAYDKTREVKQFQQENFYARDIMSKNVVFSHQDETILKAYELMNKRNLRHLPVLDGDNNLCGIISDRDILNYQDLRGLVKDAMTKKVITCLESTLVGDIARVLLEKKFGALPVVNNRFEVVGLVTNSDILTLVVKQFRFKTSI